MSDPGRLGAIQRQVRAVRRRSNLHVAQHGLAVWVAVASAAATVVVLGALRGGRVVFALAAIAAVAAVSTVTVLLARRATRRWLRAADAPGHIDAVRGLRGRVSSVLELEGRAQDGLFALLVRQNHAALARWRPEDIVPEVVPARAFAAAVAAVSVLALVMALAPALRAPAPHVVVGDRRMDFVASDGAPDGADRLLVAPGVEHPAPEGDAGAAPEAGGAGDDTGALAELSGSLQDWLQDALGAGQRWEAGDQRPPSNSQAAARAAEARRNPAARPVAGEGETGGDAPESGADGLATRPAGEDGAGAGEPDEGGGGAGAGTETDPALYGAPHDDPGGADRFELAIAARVRTRRGGAMTPWTTAPGPDGDRRPVLAGRQRTEQPGHRMTVPASFAPLVRRLYAHPGRGAAGAETGPPNRSAPTP